MVDSREHSTKASASVRSRKYPRSQPRLTDFSQKAGLNLNIFGAVAGAFSGKSKKETAADGSSVEHRDDKAAVKGLILANFSGAPPIR